VSGFETIGLVAQYVLQVSPSLFKSNLYLIFSFLQVCTNDIFFAFG